MTGVVADALPESVIRIAADAVAVVTTTREINPRQEVCSPTIAIEADTKAERSPITF
jgi:hypothetical protein